MWQKFTYQFINQEKEPDAEKVPDKSRFKKADKKGRHVVSGELFRFSGQQFVIVLTREGSGAKKPGKEWL